jgi:hypothetical protein
MGCSSSKAADVDPVSFSFLFLRRAPLDIICSRWSVTEMTVVAVTSTRPIARKSLAVVLIRPFCSSFFYISFALDLR